MPVPAREAFMSVTDIEQEDVKAEFKHGILKLFVPKKEVKESGRRKQIYCN